MITGPAANALPLDDQLEWDTLRHGVTLEFTASSHPDAWTGPHTPATGGSPEDFSTLKKLTNPQLTGPVGPVDLGDSRAIITYDSALTAIQGIRDEAVQGHAVPTTDAVRDAWLHLHGIGRVEAPAAGSASTTRATPTTRRWPSYASTPPPTRDRFVTLSWPTGQPPKGSCTAPRTPTS